MVPWNELGELYCLVPTLLSSRYNDNHIRCCRSGQGIFGLSDSANKPTIKRFGTVTAKLSQVAEISLAGHSVPPVYPTGTVKDQQERTLYAATLLHR